MTCPACGGEMRPVVRSTPAGSVAEEYVLARMQTTEDGARVWDDSEGMPVRAALCVRCGLLSFWAARFEELRAADA